MSDDQTAPSTASDSRASVREFPAESTSWPRCEMCEENQHAWSGWTIEQFGRGSLRRRGCVCFCRCGRIQVEIDAPRTPNIQHLLYGS